MMHGDDDPQLEARDHGLDLVLLQHVLVPIHANRQHVHRAERRVARFGQRPVVSEVDDRDPVDLQAEDGVALSEHLPCGSYPIGPACLPGRGGDEKHGEQSEDRGGTAHESDPTCHGTACCRLLVACNTRTLSGRERPSKAISAVLHQLSVLAVEARLPVDRSWVAAVCVRIVTPHSKGGKMKRTFVVGAVCLGVLSALAITGSPSPVAAQDGGHSLYDRLGGIYAISLVVDDFIDRIVDNEVLNANPQIYAARKPERFPGLKFQVATMVCQATGGPCEYTGQSMKEAHAGMQITEAEWQALAADFKASLDHFGVPEAEQQELFAIVESTKGDIVASDG
jgi:hemoglobin